MLQWFEYIKNQYSDMNLPYYRRYRGMGNEKYPDISLEIKIESPGMRRIRGADKTVVILTVRLNNDKIINKVVIDLILWKEFIIFLGGAL